MHTALSLQSSQLDSPCGTKSITIHTKLLLHSCDGPGNGLVSGQQVAGATHGCVLCDIKGSTRLGRVLYGQVRRFLPPAHPMRTDPRYGPPELRAAPELRKIEDAREQAAVADIRVAAREERADIGARTKVSLSPIVFDVNEPRPSRQGYVESCALGPSAVEGLGYDYLKGARMDIVHTIKSVVGKTIKMIKGQRKPTRKKLRNGQRESPEVREAYAMYIIVHINVLFYTVRTCPTQERRTSRSMGSIWPATGAGRPQIHRTTRPTQQHPSVCQALSAHGVDEHQRLASIPAAAGARGVPPGSERPPSRPANMSTRVLWGHR
jgi:hypothetical protein